MDVGIVHNAQWCDSRDMTADGHTKGSIDRELFLEVMSGNQLFKYDVKHLFLFGVPRTETNLSLIYFSLSLLPPRSSLPAWAPNTEAPF
eukprot:9500309-Pyramimonas_sp.AAC.1